MNHGRAPGLAAIKEYTTLGTEVVGVTMVECESRVLQPMSRWDFPPPDRADIDVVGKPEFYDVVGRKLYLWPVPDRIYNLMVTWDGRAQPVVTLSLPPGWRDAYEKALAAARVSVPATTTQ